MKKQNVNNKLAFGKATVTELNGAQLANVNGGSFSSPSSNPCGIIVKSLQDWLAA